MDWLSLVPKEAQLLGVAVLCTGPWLIALLTGRLIPKSQSDARVADKEQVGNAYKELYLRADDRGNSLADLAGAGTQELVRNVAKLVVAVTGQEEHEPEEVPPRANV